MTQAGDFPTVIHWSYSQEFDRDSTIPEEKWI